MTAACVLASEAAVSKYGLSPIAKVIAYADAATAPIDFPIAPSFAVPKLLSKAGLNKEDISLWEVNEAFSVVALANCKILGIDESKVNVFGGGVSLGHPIGSVSFEPFMALVQTLFMPSYFAANSCRVIIFDTIMLTIRACVTLTDSRL